jgi:3-methylcrotonyl-CoA carboxylase alpha subunit
MIKGSETAPGRDGSPLFSKVLIANRGEIAVRIARTCRAMGIRTVAVFSDADSGALHVQMADEAIRIGPPPALQSYLNQDAILHAAAESGAVAIHPGYGFLAENADFAEAVIAAGLTWIGPPPDVISRMGDKVAAKALARSADVPVIPGYDAVDQSPERFAEEAERIGYPVMVKAVTGGGGKGMRIVTDPDGTASALESARREAQSAFGDDRVFLEKLLDRPRHVEVQILADGCGTILHLGERDCSIQRRHQKVIEETPSPVVTPEMRAAMGEAAVRLARNAGYVNAGTVEFMLDGSSFYFLEMNTRLQVEHPVTEEVTGLDLVRLQLEIAAGHPLAFSQLEVVARGHAIEARVYAEDPENGFLPATGFIKRFAPAEGPGLRNDVGVFSGGQVGPYYDPLLAKLIVSGSTRQEAVTRLGEALDSYALDGVTTNLDFLRWLADQREFRTGHADITFVERNWRPDAFEDLPPEVLFALAVHEGGGALLRGPALQGINPALQGINPALQGISPTLQGINPTLQGISPYLQGVSPALQGVSPALRGVSPALRDVSPALRGVNSALPHPGSPRLGADPYATAWRQRGLRRAFRYVYRGHTFDVSLSRLIGGGFSVTAKGRTETVIPLSARSGALRIGNRVAQANVLSREVGWRVDLDGHAYFLTVPGPSLSGAYHHGKGSEPAGAVSPMPGTVIKLMVEVGQRVKAREPLVVLEAMKMEHVIEAPQDGVVKAIRCEPGDLVQAGSVVVDLAPE